MAGFNVKAVAALTAGATEWAKAYVAITEALIREGVPEARARLEAMMAANLAASRREPEDDQIPGDEWMR